MNLKSLGVVVTIILLLLPSASAFECENVNDNNVDSCKAIENSELDKQEKEILILNMFTENEQSPDHDFIYEWNTREEALESPDGISKHNDGYIKNGWMKIFAIIQKMFVFPVCRMNVIIQLNVLCQGNKILLKISVFKHLLVGIKIM